MRPICLPFAATYIVLSINSAVVADLEGSRCADLEERVAELEAMAARKGTRKTSLEVWGLVNQATLHWNARSSDNVFPLSWMGG